MVDHIAVAASVVVPAHLEQCEEGNLAVIISPVIVVQCHMRNTLVRIDAEHSEVVCDLLQQSNIRLPHFPPHFIVQKFGLDDVIVVLDRKNSPINTFVTHLDANIVKAGLTPEGFIVVEKQA